MNKAQENKAQCYLAMSRKALQLEVLGCREEKDLLDRFGVGKVGVYRPQGIAG